jgi:hypothetical protein
VSAVAVVLVGVGLVISGLGVVAFYYALWRGLLRPLRVEWRAAPRDARRRAVIVGSSTAVLVIVFTAVVIIGPFGPHTVPYVLGGYGVALFLWLNGYVVSLVWQSRRRK